MEALYYAAVDFILRSFIIDLNRFFHFLVHPVVVQEAVKNPFVMGFVQDKCKPNGLHLVLNQVTV